MHSFSSKSFISKSQSAASGLIFPPKNVMTAENDGMCGCGRTGKRLTLTTGRLKVRYFFPAAE